MSWLVLNTRKDRELELQEFFRSLDASHGVEDVYFPIRREKNKSGNVVLKPTLARYLFVNIKDECLRKSFDSYGYFIAREEKDCRLFFGKKQDEFYELEQILKKSLIDERDFYMFRTFNDKLLDLDDEIKVVDDSYAELELDKNTVNIIEGPLIGFNGVVRQVKSKKKKDHKLVVRVGDMCIQISSIRQFQHILVKEQKRGEKIEKSKTWQNIDHLKGLLQAQGYPDDATELLKSIIIHTKGKDRGEAIEFLKDSKNEGLIFEREFMKNLDNLGDSAFTNIIHSLPASKEQLSNYLSEMIPAESLRPFLTPTPGISIPDNKKYGLLQHKDFNELIARINIKPFFTQRIKGEIKLDGNFTYYAHIALAKGTDGKTIAKVNWGEFAKRLFLMKDAEVKEFIDAKLTQQEFPTLCKLIETIRKPKENTYSLRLEQTGFSFEVNGVENNDDFIAIINHPIIKDLITAAVEVFQTCRFAEWRFLLKRYVLLHNIS